MTPTYQHSNPSPGDEQPYGDFADYPPKVVSYIAGFIMPLAIDLMVAATATPADRYRRELGALIAPLLRLWNALESGTDPVALFGLHMAADDAADGLATLLQSTRFGNDVFPVLTGQDVTGPELAWQIKSGFNTVEDLQDEISALVESDPGNAVYLQYLLNKRRQIETD